MTFFKINKQSGEDNLENHPLSEESNKGALSTSADDGALRREVPFRPDGKVLAPLGKQRKGTITIILSTAAQEVARFQISDPSLFQRTIEIIGGVLSQIDEPQVEILGDCNCNWCQQKISEIKEALSS